MFGFISNQLCVYGVFTNICPAVCLQTLHGIIKGKDVKGARTTCLLEYKHTNIKCTLFFFFITECLNLSD